MIYRLKHPDPRREGFVSGVDFYGGYGTTSSLEDANRHRLAGCEVTTIENGVEKPVEIVGERHKVKFPNTKQEIETGPVVLRAVVVEKQVKIEGGAAQAVPSIVPPSDVMDDDAGFVVMKDGRVIDNKDIPKKKPKSARKLKKTKL